MIAELSGDLDYHRKTTVTMTQCAPKLFDNHLENNVDWESNNRGDSVCDQMGICWRCLLTRGERSSHRSCG